MHQAHYFWKFSIPNIELRRFLIELSNIERPTGKYRSSGERFLYYPYDPKLEITEKII